MPAPTFPNYLKLLARNFGQQRGTAGLRTPMENRFVKQRKTQSRVLIQRPLSYLVESLANYNSFMTWFRTDIAEGATWFDWTDPVDGATKSARIVMGSLKDALVGNSLQKWELSFTLETWSA